MSRRANRGRPTSTTASLQLATKNIAPAAHGPSTSVTHIKNDATKIVSMRELNALLLTRMQTAERTAEHLQQVHSTDIAAIAALQAKIVELELCILEKDHVICKTRALAANRKEEVCSVRVYAEGWDVGLQELNERMDGYERELEEVKTVIARKENEVERTMELMQEMGTERKELLRRVGEKERLCKGLIEKMRDMEERGRSKTMSLSTVGSSSLEGKGDARSEFEVTGAFKWWCEKVWECTRRVCRTLVGWRGEEVEPLLGRTG